MFRTGGGVQFAGDRFVGGSVMPLINDIAT